MQDQWSASLLHVFSEQLVWRRFGQRAELGATHAEATLPAGRAIVVLERAHNDVIRIGDGERAG